MNLERPPEDRPRRFDPAMMQFNARIAMLVDGRITPLGDEMIPAEDDPDIGDFAVLMPPDEPLEPGSSLSPGEHNLLRDILRAA